MDTKLSRKEASHRRIVDVAARAIRRAGYSGVGVADIMKEAGLTHGGFYAHFRSRDAMLAEALEHAGTQSRDALEKTARQSSRQGISPFRALVEAYLSDAHCLSTEKGCPVAALASEMPRQSPEVQAASRRRVNSLLDAVQRALPPTSQPADAEVVASTLVGALVLARAVGEDAQARAMLAASRAALISRYDTEPAAAELQST